MCQAARRLTWSPSLYSRHHLPHLPWPSHEPTLHLAAKCPVLRSLTISWSSIQPPSLDDISCLPATLTELDMVGPHCIADWAPLSRCTALRSLYLMLPKPPAHTSPHLLLYPACATPPKPSLDATPHYRGLLAALPLQTALQRLSLISGAVTVTDASNLVQALLLMTKLHSLCLCNTRLQAAGLLTLAPGLQSLRTLQELDLSGCDLRDSGASVLVRDVLPWLSRLRELHLCRDDISVEGAAAVLQVRQLHNKSHNL